MVPIGAALLLALLLLPASGARGEGLFRDPPAGPAARDAMPVTALPGTVKRARLAMVDGAVLAERVLAAPAVAGPPPAVTMTLFPDLSLQVRPTAKETGAEGRVVWTGRPEGDPSGHVGLVVKDGRITGQVHTGASVIEIRPAGGGLHRIVEIDQSAFPKEGAPLRPPAVPSASRPQVFTPRDSGTASPTSGNTTLNILVVYGSRSAAASSDIVSEIQLAVSTSNTVYTNSGIPITLALVGTQLMSDYDETARSYTQILTDLTGTSDGRLDSVHALRTSLQADLVAYITEQTAYCGLAWLYTGSPQYGFSVTTRSCATGNLTFPHELGHNMGAEHDRYVVSDASSNAYNYGYVDTTARIRTVMAYNDACAAQGFNCTRVLYFSSPYLSYNGTALGVIPWSTTAAYNVRRLTETRTGIAGFRSGTTASVTPASGWWWNASEAGRGYSIEISGSNLFFAVYTYASDGTALWYVSSGAMTGSGSYSGTLQQYSGGQTIGGSYRAATSLGSVGTVQIYFDSETTGLIVFPDGSTTSISRFSFVTNGAVGGPAPGYPQTGWWWNASEPGRGFFIEAQNTSMFVSFYMYASTGQATWYVASGAMTSSTVFQGTVQEYAGGSTLTGTFRAPTASASLGTVTIQFPTTTTAVMTLPNGSQVPLTRFAF
jgi:hypothetical protein